MGGQRAQETSALSAHRVCELLPAPDGNEGFKRRANSAGKTLEEETVCFTLWTLHRAILLLIRLIRKYQPLVQPNDFSHPSGLNDIFLKITRSLVPFNFSCFSIRFELKLLTRL